MIKIGRLKEAIKELETALEIYPENLEIYLKLITIFEQENDDIKK